MKFIHILNILDKLVELEQIVKMENLRPLEVKLG